MVKLIIVALLLGSLTGQAIERDKVTHFGASYAMQSVMYGFSKKAFRLNKTDALIFAAFTTILITTAVEYMPGNNFDSKDILANGIGIGTASATILMFDF